MEIRFVYKTIVEEQEALPGVPVKKSKKRIPTGEGHIFKVRYDGEIEFRSMCNLAKIQIGDKTVELQSRQKNSTICKECEESWKKDPESEWNKWLEVSHA